MHFQEMEEKVGSEILKKDPEMKGLRQLLRSCDVNAANKWGETLFSCVLWYASGNCAMCQDWQCRRCKNIPLIWVMDAFLQSGFNIRSFGIDSIPSFIFSAGGIDKFYAIRYLLMNGAGGTEEAFDEALESIGGEESENRVEHWYERSDLFYAMYEIVEKYRQNLPFEGIFPAHEALGLTVDDVVLLTSEEKLHPTGRGVEFFGEIGMICKDQCLVVKKQLDMVMMNDRVHASYACALPRIARFVSGARITCFLYEHRNVKRKKIFNGEERMHHYGQRITRICFDNGWVLRITNDLGEHEDDEDTRPRFNLEHMGRRNRSRIKRKAFQLEPLPAVEDENWDGGEE